jgi:hypothetical protein
MRVVHAVPGDAGRSMDHCAGASGICGLENLASCLETDHLGEILPCEFNSDVTHCRPA